MKKFAGVLLLAAAAGLFFYTARALKEDREETRMLVRRMADAQGRESEITRLKNAVAMESFDVVSREVDHKDARGERAELARDRAALAELETAERILGSASAQESRLKYLQQHHWVILGELLGAVLIALFGLLLVV